MGTINPDNERQFEGPLQLSGALDKYESFKVTPILGTEFPNASLRSWFESPDSDILMRELAITISQRGVVFFRKQDDVTDDIQKQIVQRLGELTGKPKTSKLHIHQLFNSSFPMGSDDDELNIISAKQDAMAFGKPEKFTKRQTARSEWHTDVPQEPIPSDFSMLRMVQLPEGGGGDTLWASGYEVYDRISKPYQQFLEGLTATLAQPKYDSVARRFNKSFYSGPRGSPENVELGPVVHPVIRTNPVTGWKSLFTVGKGVKKINGLTEIESENLLKWFMQLIIENHDLQLRHRWASPNDVAIWDNRCVFHAATKDIDVDDDRAGHRVTGIGERPYLDPKSVSRREALGLL